MVFSEVFVRMVLLVDEGILFMVCEALVVLEVVVSDEEV